MSKRNRALTYDQVLAGVIEGIEAVDFSIGKVEPSSRIVEDLEFDSLDLVEVVMELEDRFRIDISYADADQVETVDDFVKLIMRQVG